MKLINDMQYRVSQVTDDTIRPFINKFNTFIFFEKNNPTDLGANYLDTIVSDINKKKKPVSFMIKFYEDFKTQCSQERAAHLARKPHQSIDNFVLKNRRWLFGMLKYHITTERVERVLNVLKKII